MIRVTGKWTKNEIFYCHSSYSHKRLGGFWNLKKKQTNKKKTKTKTKTDVGHKVTTKFDTGFGKVM